MSPLLNRIGVVVIGRNEGQRLVNCLDSALRSSVTQIVYVDSGSVDDSCQAAQERGVKVLTLDLSIPFTAARARNAGFWHLCEQYPSVEYVQFLDGDCEMQPGWIDAAIAALDANPNAASVSGYYQERYPQATIFNRLCQIEWRLMGTSGTPEAPGEVTQFGGIVMIRKTDLVAVGGYADNVIAAEDDELAVRLRQAGSKLLWINHNCVVHDANMHYLGQWWQRAKRCGYAYAQVSQLHGAAPERKFVTEIRKTWFWGLIIPALILVLIMPTQGLSLLLLARYPFSVLRNALRMRQQGFSTADGLIWGISCALAPLPQMLGAAKFSLNQLLQQQHQIIEYKQP
jgi:GT2 family glycosyltransferase